VRLNKVIVYKYFDDCQHPFFVSFSNSVLNLEIALNHLHGFYFYYYCLLVPQCPVLR